MHGALATDALIKSSKHHSNYKTRNKRSNLCAGPRYVDCFPPKGVRKHPDQDGNWQHPPWHGKECAVGSNGDTCRLRILLLAARALAVVLLLVVVFLFHCVRFHVDECRVKKRRR